MSTLWTFGDSMTFGHGCNDECHSNIKEDYLLYKKEGDNIWPNHLGKLLNSQPINLAKCGSGMRRLVRTSYDWINNNLDKLKDTTFIFEFFLNHAA